MTHITFDGLRIAYPGSDGEHVAVDGFSTTIERGEFVSIVGPSGCGKSSVLMVADGLLPAAGGRIMISGRAVSKPGPDRAMVFQDASLLPWRTVESNIAFGPEMRRVPKTERLAKARDLVRRVGLEGREGAYPSQLSGGMRQRVGIARALANDPEVLLMDEPFGALDAQTRELMSSELLRIWDEDRKTVLFVTHSVDEAIFLSDRVLVMGGRPSRIVEEIRIDLPRPRTPHVRETDAYVAYRAHLADLLMGPALMADTP